MAGADLLLARLSWRSSGRSGLDRLVGDRWADRCVEQRALQLRVLGARHLVPSPPGRSAGPACAPPATSTRRSMSWSSSIGNSFCGGMLRSCSRQRLAASVRSERGSRSPLTLAITGRRRRGAAAGRRRRRAGSASAGRDECTGGRRRRRLGQHPQRDRSQRPDGGRGRPGTAQVTRRPQEAVDDSRIGADARGHGRSQPDRIHRVARPRAYLKLGPRRTRPAAPIQKVKSCSPRSPAPIFGTANDRIAQGLPARASPQINALEPAMRGAVGRRAAGQDRRVPRAAGRRRDARRPPARGLRRRCARRPSARWASAISTCS